MGDFDADERVLEAADWELEERRRQRKDANKFTTKDSGHREQCPTGMVRDTQDGKPRYGLIPEGPQLRLAELYARGAVKYGPNNWQKGQPLSRAYESLQRHAHAWALGDASEDHLAGVVFNAYAIMFYEEEILGGHLPEELADKGPMYEAKRRREKIAELTERIEAALRLEPPPFATTVYVGAGDFTAS